MSSVQKRIRDLQTRAAQTRAVQREVLSNRQEIEAELLRDNPDRLAGFCVTLTRCGLLPSPVPPSCAAEHRDRPCQDCRSWHELVDGVAFRWAQAVDEGGEPRWPQIPLFFEWFSDLPFSSFARDALQFISEHDEAEPGRSP